MKSKEPSYKDLYEMMKRVESAVKSIYFNKDIEIERGYYLKGKCEAYHSMLVKHKLIESDKEKLSNLPSFEVKKNV